jgi:hypothetical protein
LANPDKVLPAGARCGDLQHLSTQARERLLEEGSWV